MQTITFYSYKGGVGRTLALANVAKWLSEFKKRVCMLDFDLEAPGLHFKFRQQLTPFKFKRGIVDYIHDFVITKEVPKSIKNCVIEFKTSSKNPTIDFIPAGNASSPEYWKKLSAINWNDLFYKEDSEGIPFFLDLKEKIKSELNPEFLLVDSRTGISEMSGITMSLYADKIVIIAANNDENLIGARDIIRSISNPENVFFGKPPEIIFVLSRIPHPENPLDKRREISIVDEAKRKINYKKEDKILIIHSDRDLEVRESLKIGYRQDKKIPIVEDYLHLFNKLTTSILTKGEIKKFNIIKEAESLVQQAEEKESDNDKIELLTKAIKLLNDNDDFFLRRGIAYYSKKEYNKALSDFNTGIQLNESNYLLFFCRSLIYCEQKEYSLAISDLKKVLQLNPKYKQAYHNLGSITDESGNFNKAIVYFKKAMEIDPDYAPAYNGVAVSYRKKKNYDLAFENVYKAIELEPQEGTPYTTLAEIYSDIGNRDEFYKNIELALIFNFDVESFLSDETYKPYLKEEKFIKLLEKYNKRLKLNLINSKEN